MVQVAGHRVSPAIWGNAEVSGPNCWCLFLERRELLLLYSQLRTLLTTSWASRNLPRNMLFLEKMEDERVSVVLTNNPENETQ